MAQLTLNGIDVYLSENDGIRLTRGNNLLDGSDSYTLPIELPLLHPANAQAVDYLHKLKVIGDRRRTFTAKYKAQGLVLIDGTATLVSLSEEVAELTIKGNTLDFWESIAEIDMDDITFPSIPAFDYSTRTLDSVMAELNSTLTEEKDYLCFELINEPDLRDVNQEVTDISLSGMFNYWNLTTQSFGNNTSTHSSGYDYNNNVFIRMHVALDCIFSALGYTVEFNCFAESWLKDMVIINVFNLWEASTCTYGDFLPDGTVYNFLDQVRQSGYHFSIDTAGLTVSITTVDAMLTQKPTVINNIVKGSRKITVEDAPENFKITMPTRGQWCEEKIEDNIFEKMKNSLSYTGAVRTYTDLPFRDDSYIGVSCFVYAEGVFYEMLGANSWKRRSGFTMDYSNGEDIELETQISVALSLTVFLQLHKLTYVGDGDFKEVDDGPPHYRQRTIVNFNTEEDDTVYEAIIITVYRGMDISYSPVSDDYTVSDKPYPRAMYLNTNSKGVSSNLWETGYSTGYLKGITEKKIELLSDNYELEYQFKGRITDMLNSNFPPLLVDGQQAILKQRNAKITEQSKEILITDTVLISQ